MTRIGILAPVALSALLLLGTATSALAEDVPTPGKGPAFGEHVSEMAPEHPMDHGAIFGECVSTMASEGTCPHHGS